MTRNTKQTLRIGILAALIVIHWVCTAHAAPPTNPAKVKWMKALHDTLPMCKLSVPGTHDSGSTRGGRALKTQTLSISAQLQQGIRAFDIRLQKRKNKLGIFHSHAFQGIYWETDVLPTFINFLQAHPSETLIVSVKKEGGAGEDYTSLLSRSLLVSSLQRYFVKDFDPKLTLGACRGKILFLHRDSVAKCCPGAVCTGWADNASCILTLRNKNGAEAKALLQDEYQYKTDEEADQKVLACIRHFDKAADAPASSRCWAISFTSATGLPSGTPLAFANRVNPQVVAYLKKEQPRHCGIVFIDFVNSQAGKELTDYLIHSNRY